MPSNKKKKKPTGNPARGFATTSTASKTKPLDVEESNPDIKAETADPERETPEEHATFTGDSTKKDVERPLHDLSPEELEKQLEESTLQVFIETHGGRVRKDVSRQVSRLQTERRLLRNQAQPLSSRRWLPEEIMQLIVYQLDAQQNSQPLLDNASGFGQAEGAISEDDLLGKMWTLWQILPQLGFSLDGTQQTLRHLLNIGVHNYRGSLSTGKDSIWGLDECLSWLALASKTEDLPQFETSSTQKLSNRNRTAEESLAADESEADTPPESRPLTPPSQGHPIPTNSSPSESRSPSSQTESDSDLEPEQLVEKYLSLQRRLYDINPESFGPNNRVLKASKRANSNAMTAPDHNQTIDRLTAKLSKIKADILFDEDEAKRRWAEIQIDLAKEAAERKRLGIHNKIRPTNPVKVTNGRDRAETLEDDGGVLEMLGDLFTSNSPPTNDAGSSGAGTTDLGKSVINIRDFGRWTGLSPRRVFEEACKSRQAHLLLCLRLFINAFPRDSSARITYKLLSESSFSKRHSLTVKWSREHRSTHPVPIDSLLCQSSPRSLKVQMLSVACPDVTQSEAYISTIALFSVFASTPEQKVYMRLPSVWRDLWEELSKLSKEHQDAKDRGVLRELRSMIEKTEKSGDRRSSNGMVAKNSIIPKEQRLDSTMPEPSRQLLGKSPSELKALWMAKERTASYQQMLPARLNLPVYGFKNDLLSAIAEYQVVIVCGETGCGKSTQVPAYILENELTSGRSCKIYCTEPRRISAISLARRVSEELGDRKGDVGASRSLIGYAIRLESRMSSCTRLVYATTGIVMRMLEGADELGEITHLVLDEVHERSIDSDFLLIVLKKLLFRRPDLKVILMSATVDAQKFSSYLSRAPILNIPGRTFPVETKYLEDAIQETHFDPAASTGGNYGDDDDDIDRTASASAKTSLSADHLGNYSADTCNALLKYDEYRINYDLILKLLVMIATTKSYSSYSKAILIFLPGIAEIRRLNDMVASQSSFRGGWQIHSLHSTIAMEEQEKAFIVPPEGTRKIVLATNIAETGITIPDVTCVIDTGKHKEMRFDERRQLSRLVEVFISRTNAKQRRGRAGRVQKGLCFHLFTQNRHDKIMPEEQTPEMLRLSLQDLVLRVKICKLGGIEQTLGEALDAPSLKNIRRAIDSLIDVKALTTSEALTPLGRRLAKLPLDVFLGKLVLLGAIFGCLDAMVTIAAILSSKSPFSASLGGKSQMDVARLAFKKGESDLLTTYNAYCAWRRVCGANGMSEFQFCRQNFLNQQTLSNIEDLKAQLITSLVDAGFVRLEVSEKASLHQAQSYSRKHKFVELPDRYNKHSDDDRILNSVIAWSFYPKLLQREGKGWRNTANNQVVSLHPTSVNKGMEPTSQWLSFYHIMQSSNKFYNAHETSPVEDFAVVLVCGEADFKMYSGVMVIDGNRIRFSFEDWKTMSALKALRTQIRQIMAQSFRNPERSLTQQQQGWLDILEKIFALREKASN